MSGPPVVVITGASSGIGRATALRFGRKGANLILVSRRQAALDDLAAQCEALGSAAFGVAADVSSEAEVSAAAQAALSRFGRIDVWVNAAAVGVFATVDKIPLDDFRRVIDVNVMGYVYGTRAALAAMLPARRGVVINVASILAEVPQPYSAPYGMSKAAVRALGVSARSELQVTGVTGVSVVTVLPPTIDTPFFRHAANYTGRDLSAMPPVYSADRVARTIVRAAAKPRPEIVIGALGRALVRQHRASPVAAEKQLALQTEALQFSAVTGVRHTQGTLYDPPTDDAEVSGGWRGRQRTVRRVLAGVAVLAVTVVLAPQALKVLR